MKICIDPGHSGPLDPGACVGEYTEAQINLDISKKIGELLLTKGHDIIYTREREITDDGFALRAELANTEGADLFLSIHCSAATYPEVCGVETYCRPGSAAGRRLAECIKSKLAASSFTRITESDFTLLHLVDMPAVLIECGFITNEHDRFILTSSKGQQMIAAAVVSGIETYLV